MGEDDHLALGRSFTHSKRVGGFHVEAFKEFVVVGIADIADGVVVAGGKAIGAGSELDHRGFFCLLFNRDRAMGYEVSASFGPGLGDIEGGCISKLCKAFGISGRLGP